MHKFEVFEAKRSDGKSDKIDFIVDDDGKLHFVVDGNLAMIILHMINNPDEETLHSLKQISELYETSQKENAEIHVVKDPFEALRIVKEEMPEGPAKEEAINKLLEQISRQLKQNGASC